MLYYLWHKQPSIPRMIVIWAHLLRVSRLCFKVLIHNDCISHLSEGGLTHAIQI